MDLLKMLQAAQIAREMREKGIEDNIKITNDGDIEVTIKYGTEDTQKADTAGPQEGEAERLDPDAEEE